MGGASSVVGQTAEPKSKTGNHKDVGDSKKSASSKNEKEEEGEDDPSLLRLNRPTTPPTYFTEVDENENEGEGDASPYGRHSSVHSQEQSGEESPKYSDSQSRLNEEMFAHTAMSLDMDNDDLLFNLLYFESNASNLGQVLNNVQEETYALHSENNTPYKLKPASEKGMASLKFENFAENDEDQEKECAICKDDIEYGDPITRLKACNHYFHEECLVRWAKLQGWCPVCRTNIDEDLDLENNEGTDEDHCVHFGSECKSSKVDEFHDEKVRTASNEISPMPQAKQVRSSSSSSSSFHLPDAVPIDEGKNINNGPGHKSGTGTLAQAQAHHDNNTDINYGDEIDMDYRDEGHEDEARMIASSITDIYLGTAAT